MFFASTALAISATRPSTATVARAATDFASVGSTSGERSGAGSLRIDALGALSEYSGEADAPGGADIGGAETAIVCAVAGMRKSAGGNSVGACPAKLAPPGKTVEAAGARIVPAADFNAEIPSSMAIAAVP